jgi:hypothetical protein
MTPLLGSGRPLPWTSAAHHQPTIDVLLGVLAVRVPAAETAPAGQRLRSGSPPAPEQGSEYAQLSRQIKQAGLLQRRPAYYIGKITFTAAALAAGWAALVLVGDSWWTLAVAAFLAVMFTQAGFLGHDAGHRQICSTKRPNYIIGIVCGTSPLV